MSLAVRFWGTRGSIPTPGAHTVRYGGTTPCVELRTDAGGLIILDAGTGIRELGRTLVEEARGGAIRGDIFLSHTHWDHIQGIPFFDPMFQGGNHFTIWASAALAQTVDQVLRDQMSPVVFPVRFEELRAAIDVRGVREGTTMGGTGYAVTTLGVQHPGGALGYRFSVPNGDGGDLVYVPDNELAAHPRYGSAANWRARMVAFVQGAAVLIHDTTYTTAEYEHHQGWGHSTYADAVELAIEASVGTLVLFHHSPRRSDDQLEQCLTECQQIVNDRGATLTVVLAAEGLTLTL